MAVNAPILDSVTASMAPKTSATMVTGSPRARSLDNRALMPYPPICPPPHARARTSRLLMSPAFDLHAAKAERRVRVVDTPRRDARRCSGR